MPVQIPTIREGDAPTPDSVGRIDATAPSGDKMVGQVTNELAQGLVTTQDYLDTQERNVAHTEAITAATKYEKWANEQLDGNSETGAVGLRNMKGDPTPLYNNFDKDAVAKQKELLDGYSDASPVVQGYVENALKGKGASVYNKRLTAYGHQYANYEQSVTDDAVTNEVQNAAEAAGLVDPKNPSTYATFEQAQANISHLIIRDGIKKGTVQVLPEGETGLNFIDDNGKPLQVRLNPSAALELGKQTSKATYQAIDGLLKADKPDEAKAMMDRYKGSLSDPVQKAKLDEEYTKVDTEQKAYGALGNMQDMSYPEQKKALGNLPAESPQDIKVKHKAMELLHSENTIKDLDQERNSKDVFNQLAIRIQKQQESGKPFDTLVQLQQDPVYKRLIDQVTDEKQRKALTGLVEQPKKDDEQAYATLMDKTVKGELNGMSYPDYMQLKQGLTKQSALKFDNLWQKANTQTDGDLRAQHTYIGKEANTRLEASGLITKNEYGRYTPESQTYLADAQTRLVDQMNALPKMNVKDQDAFVKKFVANEIITKKQNDAKPGFWGKLFGAGDENSGTTSPDTTSPGAAGKTVPLPRTTSYSSLSPDQQVSALSEFKKAHSGARPKDTAELMTWYTTAGKK